MTLSKEASVGRRNLLIALCLCLAVLGLLALSKQDFGSIGLFAIAAVLSYFVFLGFRVAIWIFRILSLVPIGQVLFFIVVAVLGLAGFVEIPGLDRSLLPGALLSSVFIIPALMVLCLGFGAAALFYILWLSKPVKTYWKFKRESRTSP
jgi:hypothetical protein